MLHIIKGHSYRARPECAFNVVAALGQNKNLAMMSGCDSFAEDSPTSKIGVKSLKYHMQGKCYLPRHSLLHYFVFGDFSRGRMGK